MWFQKLIDFARHPRYAVALFILGGGGVAGGLALRPHTSGFALFCFGLPTLALALYGAFTSNTLS
jgi:hypothetical protein